MDKDNGNPIYNLYQELIRAWNNQKAQEFAGLFALNGNCVGFDGSQLIGKAQIETSLKEIFGSHPTASYVTIVRQIQSIGEEVSILRANVGMVPHGKDDIEPARNAIQCMVARKQNEKWEILLFQNTPAEFHGRPELTEALTKELRALI